MEEEKVRDFSRNNKGGNDRRGGGRFGGGNGGSRQMHKTTCSNCGRDCEVPFRPTGDKPVYCRDCFNERGGNDRGRNDNRRSYDRNDRRDSRPQRSEQNNRVEFEALNKKLDILLDSIAYIKKTMKKDVVDSLEIDELVPAKKPKKKAKAKPKTKSKAKKT